MKITIEVFADMLCPFCYIGKRNLEKAIEEFQTEVPGTTFETMWRPFLAWPDVGGQGHPKETFYNLIGRPYLLARVREVGKPLNLTFPVPGKTGPSRHAAALLALTLALRGPAAQDRLAEYLFHCHFESDVDISDSSFLSHEAAAVAGLDSEVVASWLDDPSVNAAINEQDLRARRLRVEGAPSFLVGGRYLVGGSQEPDVFVSLFRSLVKEVEERGVLSGQEAHIGQEEIQGERVVKRGKRGAGYFKDPPAADEEDEGARQVA